MVGRIRLQKVGRIREVYDAKSDWYLGGKGKLAIVGQQKDGGVAGSIVKGL